MKFELTEVTGPLRFLPLTSDGARNLFSSVLSAHVPLITFSLFLLQNTHISIVFFNLK